MKIPTEWVVEPVVHDDEKRIAIRFAHKQEWNDLVRSLTGVRWSKRMRCWHVNDTEYYRKLFGIPMPTPVYTPKDTHPFSEGTPEKIEALTRWMRSRRYSENTIATYTDALKTFFKYYSHKKVEEITNLDVVNYNNDYILKNNYSFSFQNQNVNALKLFFRIVKDAKIDTEKIHRPRAEHKLPNVLSKAEVKQILDACGNIKHKAMLTLIYSCGLRRSELLNLTFEDIDVNRKLVIIKLSKGNKDRITPLSDKVLDLLRTYYKAYKPKVYLFEGQYGGKYDERSLASVLKRALKIADIQKPVTLHWLRHSYATHLLESGTDLRYIQELLGHRHSKTTEIYTHVSTRNIQNIKSPFDDLDI